jgi:hypothetical protein
MPFKAGLLEACIESQRKGGIVYLDAWIHLGKNR